MNARGPPPPACLISAIRLRIVRRQTLRSLAVFAHEILPNIRLG